MRAEMLQSIAKKVSFGLCQHLMRVPSPRLANSGTLGKFFNFPVSQKFHGIIVSSKGQVPGSSLTKWQLNKELTTPAEVENLAPHQNAP